MPVLPLLAVLAVLLAGLLQARKNTRDPALLRWPAWELAVGAVLVLVALARPPLPQAGATMFLPLLLVLLLVAVLVLKRRRDAANAVDF